MKVANLKNMMNLAKVMDLTKFHRRLRFQGMKQRDGYNKSGEFDKFGKSDRFDEILPDVKIRPNDLNHQFCQICRFRQIWCFPDTPSLAHYLKSESFW